MAKKRKPAKRKKATKKRAAPKRRKVRRVRKVPLKVAPTKKFKQNHAWAVLGLLFSLLGLGLIYYKWC